MPKPDEYRKFTQYDLSSSGLKKLDFIIQQVEQYASRGKQKESRILEVGCGTGNISIPLASFGYNVTAIDIDEGSVSYARSKNPFPNCTFMVGDIQTTNFTDRFDVIICSELLEHLPKPEVVVGIMAQNIREDGLLMVTIPNGYGPYQIGEVGLRLSGKLLNKTRIWSIGRRYARAPQAKTSLNVGIGSEHVQFFTLRRFRNMIGQFNLEIVRIRHSTFISGMFPLSLLLRRSAKLCRLDMKLADILPSAMVSGWYFTLRKGRNTESLRCSDA